MSGVNFPITSQPDRTRERTLAAVPREGFLALLHATDNRLIVLAPVQESEFQRALLLAESVMS